MAGIFIIAVFFLSAFIGSSARASVFSFSRSGVQNSYAGDEFKIDAQINCQGASLNALEGNIIFPADLLELENITTEKSIINLWVEQPKVENSANGTIFFSGITPGGFAETNANVFSIYFKTKKTGQGTISWQGQKALLNDGAGTDSKPTANNLAINIKDRLDNGNPAVVSAPADSEPPEDFTPEIVRDNNLFNNQNVLIFNTQDKETGINHYEVKEEKIISFLGLSFKTGSWKTAISPYLLKDQKLGSNIYVKAVDNTGNEQIETISALQPVRWYENFLIWCIIILAALFIAVWIVKKNYDRKK